MIEEATVRIEPEETWLPIPASAETVQWLGEHPHESAVLRRFVGLMAHELAANNGKGNRPAWLGMERGPAVAEVHWHASKLAVAAKELSVARADCGIDSTAAEVATRKVREYAADTANCALMLADVLGLVEPEEIPHG